jgi:hypothetical protein
MAKLYFNRDLRQDNNLIIVRYFYNNNIFKFTDYYLINELYGYISYNNSEMAKE